MTVEQLKSVLSGLQVSFTKEQTNKADLLVLVDRRLKRIGLTAKQFFDTI